MRHQSVFLRIAFLACISMPALLLAAACYEKPQSPLSGVRQLLLVIADADSSSQAIMGRFARDDGRWRMLDSWPAAIGKNGLGWGLGLHRDEDRVPGEPVKREGDNKSPAGMFALPRALGYAPSDSVRCGLPYVQATPDMIGVDDVSSEYYNQVINFREKGLDPENLPSHEDMRRGDDLYKYVIVIGHNLPEPKPGAGSCIFLHLWNGPGSHTAGCTAMDEERMTSLLAWLDPSERPVIVQLTRAGYEKLKKKWGLPRITL